LNYQIKMKKTTSKLVIESFLNHKEKIEPTLYSSLENKSHYNANNSVYPEMVGRGNYLAKISNDNFVNTLSKMKRVHGIDDINPQQYFEIKKNVSKLLKEIISIESQNMDALAELAESIIREQYDVPSEIKFSINGEEVDEFDGTNILETFKETYPDFQFDDYTGIQGVNQTIDRQRMNYCLICGGAHNAMNMYKIREDELDSIDYRLYNLYDKFNAFNNFNLWVTPDEILSKQVDDQGNFTIYDDGGGYIILVNAQSFLSMLYEMSKAILSILFQEKYNNPHVDYDNPWNTRIGAMAWNKFRVCANKNKNFPYVVDAINQLDDDDYTYVIREVLSETNHSKKIFEELYESFT
jgi:predicted small metal-binding protein